MNDFVRKHIDDLKALKTKSITDKTTQATIKRIDQIIKLFLRGRLPEYPPLKSSLKA